MLTRTSADSLIFPPCRPRVFRRVLALVVTILVVVVVFFFFHVDRLTTGLVNQDCSFWQRQSRYGQTNFPIEKCPNMTRLSHQRKQRLHHQHWLSCTVLCVTILWGSTIRAFSPSRSSVLNSTSAFWTTLSSSLPSPLSPLPSSTSLFGIHTSSYFATDIFKSVAERRADTFWSQPRSALEIRSFIENALEAIEGPAKENGLVEKNDDTESGPVVRVLLNEPPLIAIDNFASDAQCDAIMAAAIREGLTESRVGIDQSLDESRTSDTAWLHSDKDFADGAGVTTHTGNDSGHLSVPVMQVLAERVSRVCGIPPCNMESLQVVRYRPGQQFQVHTDHQDDFNEVPIRGRLCTCLLYLKEPEAGGETRFYEYDIRVPPKKGTVIFWWNTLERPGCPGYHPEMFLNVDNKMRHAGEPVEAGEKWICNRWVHPVDCGKDVRGYNSHTRSY